MMANGDPEGRIFLSNPHTNNIKIHHECESGIEKSVPRITVWHHEACRVMTNYDPEGQIFMSHPQKSTGFFFLPTIKYCILCLKRHPEVPEYAEM